MIITSSSSIGASVEFPRDVFHLINLLQLPYNQYFRFTKYKVWVGILNYVANVCLIFDQEQSMRLNPLKF